PFSTVFEPFGNAATTQASPVSLVGMSYPNSSLSFSPPQMRSLNTGDKKIGSLYISFPPEIMIVSYTLMVILVDSISFVLPQIVEQLSNLIVDTNELQLDWKSVFLNKLKYENRSIKTSLS